MHKVMSERFALYWVAGVVSVILSCWAFLHAEVINPDGICYLQSAATMSAGLSAATHLCDQAISPFYSMIIFGFVKITGLAYFTAASILNGFFSLLTVLMFIAITGLLTTSKRICGLAAVVILVAHQFNDVRADIIRDHGYWAFYLMSVYFLLQFQRRFTLTRAVMWSGSLMLATLFRIEGAVFLLFLPLAVFFNADKKFFARIVGFVQLNLLTLIAGIFLSVWLMLHATQSVGRLTEIQFHVLHGLQRLAENFHASTAALAQHVLNIYAQHDAALVLLVMLVGWYLVSVISNVSLIYAFLIVYAWVKRLATLDRAAKLTLWAYIILNVIVTGAYLVDYMFLAKRYLLALSLVLMLWVPFALENLIQERKRHPWLLYVVVLFISVWAVGGVVHFGHSKKYIHDAGDWLKVHAPMNAKIYSNDYQVLYYSDHFGNAIFTQGKQFADLKQLAGGKWRQYDYLALRVSKKDQAQEDAILQEIKMAPIVVFQNDRVDQVRIYQVK